MLHITSLWSFLLLVFLFTSGAPVLIWLIAAGLVRLIYIRDLLRITEPRLAFAGRLLFFSFALWHVTSVILVAIFFLYLFFAWSM